MFRRDYLVKQLETFGKALALAIGQRKRNEIEAYERSFAELTQTYAGISVKDLGHMATHEFNQLLEDGEVSKKKIFAALLFEYYLQMGDSLGAAEQLAAGQRCLLLYQNISEDISSGAYDLDVHYKLQVLKENLS